MGEERIGPGRERGRGRHRGGVAKACIGAGVDFMRGGVVVQHIGSRRSCMVRFMRLRWCEDCSSRIFFLHHCSRFRDFLFGNRKRLARICDSYYSPWDSVTLFY